ncbi:unnamed protein product, partial [Brenthis ino]
MYKGSSSSDNDISSIGDYVNENHILETKDTASCGTDKEVGDAKVTPDLNNEVSDDEFFDVDPPDVHEPVDEIKFEVVQSKIG